MLNYSHLIDHSLMDENFMAPYQSQRTSDIQAKIASYQSDLDIESPPYETLKAKPQLTEAERTELALRKGRIKSIKDDLAELNTELAASKADDHSEKNMALHAEAWTNVGKVYAVHGDVSITHANRLDEHLGNALQAAAARDAAGKAMADKLTDSIHTLAKDDYLAVDRSVGPALPRLRMHSLDDAKALVNWFQRITKAAGCEHAIANYLTFHYAIDRTTCTSVAEKQAEFVTAKLTTAIKDNGLEPADIACTSEVGQ